MPWGPTLCESGLSEGPGLPRSTADQPWWSHVLLVAGSPCQGRAGLIDGPPSLRNRLMRHLPAVYILAAEARAGSAPRAFLAPRQRAFPRPGGDPLPLPGSALRHADGGLCPGVSQVAL